MKMSEPSAAEQLARLIQSVYQKLAVGFDQPVPPDWDDVPKRARGLAIAVCAEIMPMLRSEDQALAKIIRALDRCKHGRHAADSCFDCPGGQSSGNLFAPPGTRIGTDLYGRPIVVPDAWELRHTAEYWIPKANRSETYRNGPV